MEVNKKATANFVSLTNDGSTEKDDYKHDLYFHPADFHWLSSSDNTVTCLLRLLHCTNEEWSVIRFLWSQSVTIVIIMEKLQFSTHTAIIVKARGKFMNGWMLFGPTWEDVARGCTVMGFITCTFH